jgi:hypothetical protein
LQNRAVTKSKLNFITWLHAIVTELRDCRAQILEKIVAAQAKSIRIRNGYVNGQEAVLSVDNIEPVKILSGDELTSRQFLLFQALFEHHNAPGLRSMHARDVDTAYGLVEELLLRWDKNREEVVFTIGYDPELQRIVSISILS